MSEPSIQEDESRGRRPLVTSDSTESALVSPGTTEPSLPCIVDGSVAIQLERLASVRERSVERPDSGVVEDLVTSSSAPQLTCEALSSERQNLSSALVPPRKNSVDMAEVSSQDSCSPLHSPRDCHVEENMSPFYSFLHSKGLGDCCEYFPEEMTLANFSRLTEYELINLYDIQSSHVREVVMHTIRNMEPPALTSAASSMMGTSSLLMSGDLHEETIEDDEVAALHVKRRSMTISSCTSTPPRSPSPRKIYDPATDTPSLVSRRLLHRTFSEDVKTRRRRESMPHSHSSQALNSLSANSIGPHTPIPIQILLSPIMQEPLHRVSRRQSIAIGCGANSDFSNLLRIRNSLLGHSAPNLTSSVKDSSLSVSRRSSGRSAVSTPKKMSIVHPHPRCISPQLSLSSSFNNRENSMFASPVDFRPPASPLPPPNIQSLKKQQTSVENRRWSFASYASSGYSTTTQGSNASLTSSMERVNPFFAGQELLSTAESVTSRDRFSSSESNPAIDDDSSSFLSPLPRPRSRSFSPTRAMPMDADSTFMMNSVYRERFPKAVQQMEEKLRLFISENSSVPQSDEGDGTLCFVHKQIVTLAHDCLDKCHNQLLSALYFHELSENLKQLTMDTRQRANTSFTTIDKMVRNLLMIISRTARLLECLEFDPDEFYCLLEQAEGQAKKTINTSDIPKYIISKLCLNRNPLEAILPDDLDDSECISLDNTDDTIDSNNEDSKFQMKAPEEEDFDYLKQISNGAYGVVWLVRNKYNNQRFAMKKLLKTNLVLRNQVDQVFTERDILIFADNPFVVSLYGSFETKKHLCLVMEYVEGGDCAALLKNMGPLPTDMARMYFAETVLALEYIHDYGIVHRDLKPDNLLITNEGHIKLTDFGLSKMGIMNLTTNLVEGILDRESKQFNDRQIFGTPEYIAPEVILRQGYGKPVDWWSMGIILYEFLVGCVPFFGDTPEELFSMVLSGEIEFPEEEEYALSLEAVDLILRLLERDPLRRLGTTGARPVMDHLFVNDIDWDGLLRQKAEFVPNLEGDDDTSYFDLRADRFPQHDDYEEDSDDDIMINSFSSCSPRYTKVYQKIQEMKNQQEHDSLSRQSSDNSSVFGGATHISSDSGSESPRLVTANEKVHNEDFSFDKANMASTPEFLKSSLKSNTSTPKRPTEKRDSIGKQGEKEDDSSLPSNITEGLISKRAASRSVSFDSDISGGRDRTSLTEITTPTSPLATPNSPLSPSQRKESSLAMPTSPLATPTSPVSPNHRVLRRSDALGPTAADVIHRKDNSGDTLDEADGGLLSTSLSTATTPDSVFPSAPSTPPTVVPTTQSETAPLQYDVLPDVNSYTPVPVLPVSTTASLPPMITSSMDPLTVVTSSQLIRSNNKAHHPLSLSLGATSTTESLITPILPITFTEPTSLTSSNTGETMPPTEALKHRLQITSSSDSASSSANNSPGSLTANQKPGSSGSISLRRNRSSVGSRLQRSKHPGNMLLAKVSQRMNRPRSHTSPDCNLAEDIGERHKSLPEVSVSRSTPSPPSHKGELSLAPGPISADIVPARRSTPSPRLSLSMRGATNSCPVPVPQSGQSGSKSMFVKSASATQLSLLIPPPQTDDFGSAPHPNVLLSPTSSASSRDQSPTRDALRRPPYILKKGRRGYGFFLKAIRVYSSDGNFYHLNHLITSVTEGSMAHQAGLRPNYLVTHINNEAVHGLPQPQIVRLIQKNSNMVTLRALPIEETSLKPGVKSQSELRKAKMITRRAVKKKQSFNKVDRRRQRSSSLLKTLSKRNAELSQPISSHPVETRKSPRSPRLITDCHSLTQSYSSASSSPLSSGQNSPANSFTAGRPGSLQGLSKSLQCLKSPNRRKSVHNIPLSPLARTPSPSPMAVSPTSQTPTSKLAVKSGSSPSTQTFKHSPRLGRGCSGENPSSFTTSLSASMGGTRATLTPGNRSRHNSVKKTESTQSDPGGKLDSDTHTKKGGDHTVSTCRRS